MNKLLVRGWPGLPLIAAIFMLGAVPAPTDQPGPQARIFRIQARSFEYTPSTLYVNPGDHVTLELTSMDYVHGVFVEGYEVNLVADPGETTRVSFVADHPGVFRMRCSVTCGAMHPFMIGKLVVGRGLGWLWAAGVALLVAIAGLRFACR